MKYEYELLGDVIYLQVPAGGQTQLVGNDQSRWSLIVGTDNTNGMFVGTRELFVAGNQYGFTLPSSYPYVEIDYPRFGTAVTRAWFARSVAGTSNVIVVETHRA